MKNNKIVSATESKIIDRDNWEYVRELIANRIKEVTQDINVKNLYIVNPKSSIKLHQVFLENIPESYKRYYICNSCFMFINRIGRLVTIDDDGNLHSLCWDIPTDDLGMFKDAIIAMKNTVEHGTVNNVFSFNKTSRHISIHDDTITLGYPVTGNWTHFYGEINIPDIQSIQYYIHEEEFRSKLEVAKNTLNKWDNITIAKVLSFIPTGKIYDSDKVKVACENLMNIKERCKVSSNHNAHIKIILDNINFIYHLGNSALGSLFDDIQSDVFYDETCIERYNNRVDPINYKRPKSAPSEALIKTATELVENLSMENSLKRRFALLSDLPNLIWSPQETHTEEDTYRSGIFSNVKNKESIKDTIEKTYNTGGNITLSKFINKILPDAKRIIVYTPDFDNYCAYTAPVDMDAPCVIRWDSDGERNPINQYVYSYGSPKKQWNITEDVSKVECVGIANSAMYLLDKDPHIPGVGILFILKDVYDTKNQSSALFADDLVKELFTIRKVIESFSNNTPLEKIDGQKACGILYTGQGMDVEVYTEYAITKYHIDRME